MKTATFKVKPWGFDMECLAEYELGEPQTFDHPGCGSSVCIITCHVGGVDIADMLTSEQHTTLEAYVISQLEAA